MKDISIMAENLFLRPWHLDLKLSSKESEDFAVVNCLGWS